jgi:hypothetical protein
MKSRRNLLLENLDLRHQLLVLTQNASRPRLNPLDRALWGCLSRVCRNRSRILHRLQLFQVST